MSRLTREGTAEPVSRDQILRRERGQGNIHFRCSADHEQDWQPYPVDPYTYCNVAILPVVTKDLPISPRSSPTIFYRDASSALLHLANHRWLKFIYSRSHGFRYETRMCVCVCVWVCLCVFFPFILDVKFVGCTSRGHTGGRSHRISHPPCRRFLESVISVSSDFIFVFIDTAPPSACTVRFGVPGSISSDNKF